MNVEQRKDYVATTAAVFCTCAILFGGMVAIAGGMEITQYRAVNALIIGTCAGWAFSSMYSGSFLGVYFVSRKSRRFKVICAVLFMLVTVLSIYAGVFVTVPYWVYSLIQIRKEKANRAME